MSALDKIGIIKEISSDTEKALHEIRVNLGMIEQTVVNMKTAEIEIVEKVRRIVGLAEQLSATQKVILIREQGVIAAELEQQSKQEG